MLLLCFYAVIISNLLYQPTNICTSPKPNFWLCLQVYANLTCNFCTGHVVIGCIPLHFRVVCAGPKIFNEINLINRSISQLLQSIAALYTQPVFIHNLLQTVCRNSCN